ncbi:hypothetical protein H0A66_03815 [Alcaligenaceae bacterium]|nr:hypothetical protein [Alcaligenaceae bacterium]
MSGQKKDPASGGAVAGRRAANSTTRRFAGTRNSRELRALSVLIDRPVMREELDRITGTSNAPDLVFGLRFKGLDIPCERLKAVDRDGKTCRPGRYSLSPADRRAVLDWARREGIWHG